MLLILAFLYIFQRFTQSGALPLSIKFSRQTNNGSPLSQECVCPDVRSIWDIVWSCFVTLFACSWVSVHPNVPGKATPWWKKYLFRLELMFWSIVAPELIIEWAMRQWFGARRLSRDYRKYKWTKTHGYFIQMGGFMLYDSEDKKPIQVLSPERFGSLLREKRIDMPSINEEEIQDRSKSDGLAKALVIIQTLWFIGQCIARKAKGLDITELELVTLALAMLNGVIYFLWWNKPLGVESTVAVILKPPPVEGDNDMSIDGHKIKAEAVTDDNRSENKQVLQHADPVTTHVRNMTPRHLAQKAWWFLSGISYRWPFALAVTIFTRISEILGTGEGTQIGTQMHVGPFYSYDCLADDDTAKVQFMLMLTAALFGAVHCAGWNFIFPSLIEAYFWRISSAIITGFPALSVMILSIMFLDEIIPIPQPLRWVIYSVMMGMFSLAIVVLPFYLLARLALLVEALISLRDLHQGALGVVKWTLSLPHI